jgi:undecaprenyl-diphosphatase
MSYLQAIVIALTQGVTELFPVSSLGHSVVVPAWLGGSWTPLVTQSSQASSETSFYLAFIVALHVGTALALLWFFRADWIRIVSGFVRSVRRSLSGRQLSVEGPDERLAWLIVIATIPVGLTGLIFEHTFRTLFAKPVAASIFLFINGLILFWAERTRRQAERSRERAGRRAELSAQARAAMPIAGGSPELDAPAPAHGGHRGARSAAEVAAAYASDARISGMPYLDSVRIGLLQILALFAGISRDGVTMVGGLWRGLDRDDAARFAFLLATPPILAAGILKLPSLTGSAGAHIHGQVIVGFFITGITAYLSVRYLVRYFRTGRTLTPFAIYCLLVGLASIIRFAIF